MAQALNKTKRRIASVSNTRKITEAMELVSTVKLKKFKGVMERNNSYAKEINSLISTLFGMLNDEENSYIKTINSNKELVVVINSNFGLCASYNSNIFSFVKTNLNKENSIILPIGLKGANNYKKEGFTTIDDYISLNEKLSYDDCVKLARFIHTEYLKNSYKSVKILYTKYINSLKFEPDIKIIFPIEKPNEVKGFEYEPIFDPNLKTLIDELVPVYLTSTLYQLLIESQVSEQASHRNAMENANDNANEIIDKLTIEFNKARQAAITQEISEVVASQIK